MEAECFCDFSNSAGQAGSHGGGCCEFSVHGEFSKIHDAHVGVLKFATARGGGFLIFPTVEFSKIFQFIGAN